jgi:outer membrane protein OmpA-like peptidoglycan-associated protein
VRTLARDVRQAKAVTCIGHTDALNPRSVNHRLGLRRARQVCAALRRHGVRAKLVARSAGETQPRATNATRAGRERNRRVEVRVGY